ncbi:Protein disulfide-isomerase 5-4, partial [Mucuna pruriens]
ICVYRLSSVYRKIPRDLTEASLSGAGLSIIAALAMVFLFGMELNSYLSVSTSTSVIVDKSSDGDYLRIDFNISFPALSCEFASVDVSDVLGTNRLNLTKTVRKFSIDSNLKPTGPEFHSGPASNIIKHDNEVHEESVEGAVILTNQNFDKYAHQFPIIVVNFYAPWCYWSQRLKPSWEKAAKIIKERYDPEMDGRIVMGKLIAAGAAAIATERDRVVAERDRTWVAVQFNVVAAIAVERSGRHSGKSRRSGPPVFPLPSLFFFFPCVFTVATHLLRQCTFVLLRQRIFSGDVSSPASR